MGVLHSYWTSELFKDDHGAESTLTLAATLQVRPELALSCPPCASRELTLTPTALFRRLVSCTSPVSSSARCSLVFRATGCTCSSLGFRPPSLASSGARSQPRCVCSPQPLPSADPAAPLDQPSHLLVCLGLIYPFSCVYYLPCALLLFEWFSKKRGLASGVLYAGTGCGGTVFRESQLPARFSL